MHVSCFFVLGGGRGYPVIYHINIFTADLLQTLQHACRKTKGEVAIAPVAETGFSHRLTVYKIVENFFGLSYLNISGNNQVDFFFRISNISVPCPHAQLRGHTIIKKLWTIFRPWGRNRS